MVRPVRRFKSHNNTSRNFIRAGFATESMVVSGSEVRIQYFGGLIIFLFYYEWI